MTSPSDDTLQAEYVQKCDEHHRDNAPYYIRLFNKVLVDARLWLVEATLNQCPSQSVDKGLDENNPTEPSVQEIKGLVWNASDQSE